MVKNNFFELGYSGKATGLANNLISSLVYLSSLDNLLNAGSHKDCVPHLSCLKDITDCYGRCGCKKWRTWYCKNF